MYNCSKRSGFTLVELLITIAIVAIVSSVGFVGYSNSQTAARDSRRKSDLKSIANALELYHQKNGQYPVGGSLTLLAPNYINTLPTDPKENGTTVFNVNGFTYEYTTPDTSSQTQAPCPDSTSSPLNIQYYYLLAHLENANDADNHSAKQYKFCNGTVLFSGTPGYLYIITSQ